MNSEQGYISYVINPRSGNSSLKKLVVGLKDYLQFCKFDVRLEYTKSLEHAREVTLQAKEDPKCNMLIISGGDGTVREICKVMSGSTKPILPVPGGTENLLASELGYDEKLSTLVRAFQERYIVDFDLCKSGEEIFVSIAGFGFDAEVVHRVTQARKGNIDHLAYFWPMWRTFWSHKFPAFTVELDDEQIYQGQGMVFVGNSSRYALGLHILKNASYNDGLIDVCIYQCHNHLGLIEEAAATVMKMHTKLGSVIYRQGRKVKISALNSAIYSQFDGDPGPELPVEIEVVPSAVKFIAPKGAKPAGLRTRLIRLFQ